MDGEAEPTMRLHLHVSHAVQGELFPSADAQPVTRGYRGTVASKVAGITYRQLDYWARKQIVEPSITPSHGSGSRRLYSFKDVVILAVSKRLLGCRNQSAERDHRHRLPRAAHARTVGRHHHHVRWAECA